MDCLPLLTNLGFCFTLLPSDFLIGPCDLLYLVNPLPPQFMPGVEGQVKMGELL